MRFRSLQIVTSALGAQIAAVFSSLLSLSASVTYVIYLFAYCACTDYKTVQCSSQDCWK